MNREQFEVLLNPVFHIISPISWSQKGGFALGYWVVSEDEGTNYLIKNLPPFWRLQIKNSNNWVVLRIFSDVHVIPKQKLWLHLFLLFFTLLTTLIAGSLQQGGEFWKNPLELLLGLDFSLTILVILGAHELGHYFACMHRGISASLPYFIPSPHPLIGTFGAFIRIRQRISNRIVLIEIGAAGPIMSFFTSMIAAIYGLYKSPIITNAAKRGIALGDSLLFKLLAYLIKGDIPKGQDLLLHPIAYAAWLGFFVTALNLIPIGQLDGGHILYSLLGKISRKISYVVYAILITVGIFYWQGWLVWGVLLIFIGLKHPSLSDESPLLLKHKLLAYFCIFILIACFVPAPFRF